MSEDCDWVWLSTLSGESTGEHDTITVNINTNGYVFLDGVHSCDIQITSNGGDGQFQVRFSEGIIPGDPCLEYDPESHDFGTILPGQTDSTTFEIWNDNTGILTYSLSESSDWLELSTTSGESTGEHDTITVEINATGLTTGMHTCDIEITSNGGTGTFTVTVNVQEPVAQSPTVEITKPLENMLYLLDKEITALSFNFIIGQITIEVEADDIDGTITKVEFYIDGVLKHNITEGPFKYNWNEKIFGFKKISVKAYDNDGQVAEDEITAVSYTHLTLPTN